MKGLKTLHFVSTNFLNSLILPKVPRSFRERHVEYSRLDLLKKWAGVAYASRLFPFTSILLEHSNPYFFLLRCRPKSRSFIRGLARNCESRLAPDLHTFLKSRIYDSENPGNRGNPTCNFVPNPHARTPRELTRLLILSLRQGECCTELKLTT